MPTLNDFPTVRNLKNGTVVRLRAMVQDSLDRVMKHKSFGQYDLRYRPGMEDIPESYKADFDCSFYNVDRYVLVSVPGLDSPSQIAPELISDFFDTPPTQGDKRTLMETDDLSTKRAREHHPTDNTMDENPPEMVPVDGDEEPYAHGAPFGSKPPHPIPDHLLIDKSQLRFSCLANVCDSDTEFKLHDVVDIVGVLYRSPHDPSLPPVDFTIEAIHIEHARFESESSHKLPETVRGDLLGSLSQILLGDETAAEYLLLQLVSNRIDGHEALPTMGSWSLSLSNTDNVDAHRLVRFIKSVSGPVVYLETSNSVLMEEKFYPLRLADAEYTSPGMLQLARKTVVIIDERTLGEGNVNALNVLAINKAVREQVLLGVFGDSSCIDFPIDLRFIILNRGRTRSIFERINPSSGINGSVPLAHVELRPRETVFDTDVNINIMDVKEYIVETQRRIKDVKISDEIVTRFQNDWVESRKNDPKIPTDDIHIWATLMRVFAASHGSETVTTGHLDGLLGSESTRRSRCPELPASRENQDIQAVIGG